MPVSYPTVTPDFSGSHYCVACVFSGRHPERTDDRIYVVRYSEHWGDRKALCTAHLRAEHPSYERGEQLI